MSIREEFGLAINSVAQLSHCRSVHKTQSAPLRPCDSRYPPDCVAKLFLHHRSRNFRTV